MTGFSLMVFVGLLAAVFLGVVALLVWQEGRRRTFETEPAYVVQEAIEFIAGRLADDVWERVGLEGVERVIDWELRYLVRDGGRHPVAGGDPASVGYITARIAEVHGAAYAPEDVGAILALEADYLATIGAIGAPVTGEGEEDT